MHEAFAPRVITKASLLEASDAEKAVLMQSVVLVKDHIVLDKYAAQCVGLTKFLCPGFMLTLLQ